MKKFALLTALFAIVSVPASAGDEMKIPKAPKELKRAVKALSKEKSYKIALEVRGGFSNKSSHEITRSQVAESFTADYYRGLMNHSDRKAIRSAKSGAIRKSGRWQQLLAQRDGVLIDRLFAFPVESLRDTLRAKNVTWLDEGKVVEEVSGGGHTVVVKEKVLLPTKLRVELSLKEAGSRFVSVQNSGCTSEG